MRASPIDVVSGSGFLLVVISHTLLLGTKDSGCPAHSISHFALGISVQIRLDSANITARKARVEENIDASEFTI